ncbi:uncharacterized protein LOC143038701 [Oratosquilla oratoria]|uniref:uncharacterized protein LOC143038701 n=1 Tax=Oratosquilla oratoria TaxID=337810 RepID=UPI003F75F6E9
MGCNGSKDVHNISVNGANRKLQESLQGLDVMRISSSSSSSVGSSLGRGGSSSHSSTAPHTPEDRSQAQCPSTVDGIPTALKDIPINDLGESLDARKSVPIVPAPSSSSTRSSDSTDSGIYDLDDDYSFVITENSPAELIKRVELDFTPVENMDLTITGKACPRMLSGYQKSREEEAAILENLRDEGLISTSRQKSGGGVSFHIVEMTPKVESAGSNKLNPKDFLPPVYKQHLDAQRSRFAAKTHDPGNVQRKLLEAEERRKTVLHLPQIRSRESRWYFLDSPYPYPQTTKPNGWEDFGQNLACLFEEERLKEDFKFATPFQLVVFSSMHGNIAVTFLLPHHMRIEERRGVGLGVVKDRFKEATEMRTQEKKIRR